MAGAPDDAEAQIREVEPDGRVRRGERNREAIVEAILQLIQDREARPTAREVAERAGVQPRTVFRHFQDMESLNAELSARVAAEVRPLLRGAVSEGTLVERVRGLVRLRAEVFERVAPFQRIARGLRPTSDFAKKDHEAFVTELRETLAPILPEIRRLPAPLAEGVELVLSFEAWDRFRADQGLSPNQTRRASEQAALALFAAGGFPTES